MFLFQTIRKISKIPFKVLDAPELQDDFYLNLVDWSSQNILSVGLGSCVYLWSACTSQVSRSLLPAFHPIIPYYDYSYSTNTKAIYNSLVRNIQ